MTRHYTMHVTNTLNTHAAAKPGHSDLQCLNNRQKLIFHISLREDSLNVLRSIKSEVQDLVRSQEPSFL